MKKHSCGAILFTIHNDKIYIILGKEFGNWFPFKGVCEDNESYEETAIREIREETCEVINIDNISLDCNFSTKNKYYHIGLVYVLPSTVKKFYTMRNKMKDHKYIEKSHIKMFDIDTILTKKLSYITMIPIMFYINYLHTLKMYF